MNNKIKKTLLGVGFKYVVILISLKIFSFIRDFLILNHLRFENDLILYLKIKPLFDIGVFVTASVYYYEFLDIKYKLSYNITSNLIVIFGALFFSFITFFSNESFFFLLLILVSQSFVSSYANIFVILAKNKRVSAYDFITNGVDTYIILILAVIFYSINLLTTKIYLFITVIVQIIILFSLSRYFHAEKKNITIEYKLNILELSGILTATYPFIIVLITRSLFPLNSKIVIYSLALTLAMSILQLFERFWIYENKNREISPILKCVFFIISFGGLILHYFNANISNHYLQILIEFFALFLLILPIFTNFTFYKEHGRSQFMLLFTKIITSLMIVLVFKFEFVIFIIIFNVLDYFMGKKNFLLDYFQIKTI